jgi:hypothetical protein
VYALARKLLIASRVGISVEKRPRSGRWKSAGARGRMVRRRVYVRVEEVSCAERVDIRWVWSEVGVRLSRWQERCGGGGIIYLVRPCLARRRLRRRTRRGIGMCGGGVSRPFSGIRGYCVVLGRSRGVSGRLQVYISCNRVKGGFLRRQQCSVNGGRKVSWIEPPDMTFWGACTWTLKLARQLAITSVTGSSHYSSFSNTLSKAFLFSQN